MLVVDHAGRGGDRDDFRVLLVESDVICWEILDGVLVQRSARNETRTSSTAHMGSLPKIYAMRLKSCRASKARPTNEPNISKARV